MAKAVGRVNTWQEQLELDAQAAAKMEESSATGTFFSTKGGHLSFNDNRFPNDEMAVIIVDHVLENILFDGAYDPEEPKGPVCFAFGRDEKTMSPHEVVEDKKCDTCYACPLGGRNAWGTAEKGKGKACKNIRRLALISAGTFDKDGKFTPHPDEQFSTNPLAFLKIPVTSTKGYAAYVKQLQSTLGRPPYGIFTRISLVDDDNDQFHVQFEALSKVPDKLMTTVITRHQEAEGAIEFPYTPMEQVDEKPKAKGKRTPPPPVKGKDAKKPAGRNRF